MIFKKNKLLFAIPILVICSGLIFYNYVYLDLQEQFASVQRNVASKTRILEKQISLLSQRAQIESDLRSLREQRKAEDLKLLEGRTHALAAATLQNTIKGILTSFGGTISSQRVENPEEHGKFKAVCVIMDAVLPDSKALSDVLYAIETQTPWLVIRELDIRVRDYRSPRELTVKLKITALNSGKQI